MIMVKIILKGRSDPPYGSRAHAAYIKMVEWFAWRPVRVKSGDWVWWQTAYYRRSPVVLKICGAWFTINMRDYYTTEEVAVMKLKGEA